MVSQEILDYIKKELARGVSEDKLRQVLLEYGWPEFEINEAFEKAKEEHVVEEASEELLKEIAEHEEHHLREKVEERVEEQSVMDGVKRIVTNKLFIIAAVIILLGSVAFFIIPSLSEGKQNESEQSIGGISSAAMDYAKTTCRQYCNSDLCGLFVNPEFAHPELQGKNCKDFGISCLQPDGKPKCETEY